MYQNAGNGLKVIFASQIIAIVGNIVPGIIGSIVGAVAMVLTLLGLKQAAMDEEGYNSAFIFTIINLVIGFLNKGNGLLSSVLSAAGSILSFCILYCICNSTKKLLDSAGENSLANLGTAVWVINVMCTIVVIVIRFVAWIPILNILAGIAAILTLLVALVGAILYLVFLSKSGNALS